MKVVLDQRAIKNIAVFQNVTGVHVLDCLEGDNVIYFIVANGQKKEANDKLKLRLLERMLKKRVKILEYFDDPIRFLQEVIPQAQSIRIDERVAKVRVPKFEKPRIIGREQKNLKLIRLMMKRLFELKDVKII